MPPKHQTFEERTKCRRIIRQTILIIIECNQYVVNDEGTQKIWNRVKESKYNETS